MSEYVGQGAVGSRSSRLEQLDVDHEAPTPSRSSSGFDNPLVAARRHPLLTLLPVVVLVAVAVAVGVTRQVTYTAQTRLSVGRLDVAAQALPGYVQAAQNLAVSYSRVISAAPVVRPVAARLHLPPATVAARVTATPIPSSSIIEIDVKAPSAPQALALANTTTASFAAYIEALNRDVTDPGKIVEQYRAASQAVSTAQSEVGRLKAAHAPQKRLVAAQTRLAVAQLHQQSLAASYQASQQAVTPTNVAQVLAPATATANDRAHTLKLLVVSAIVAGLVLGLALASLGAWRRRALRRR